MGINWKAGFLRWMPHEHAGQQYSLTHVHPFTMDYAFPESERHESGVVTIRIGFSLHCWTRDEETRPATHGWYSDEREKRAFDLERYELSKQLPEIVRQLHRSHCYLAKAENFVTVSLQNSSGGQVEYEVYFNVRAGNEPMTAELIVQSAYPRVKGASPKALRRYTQRIKFATILGKVVVRKTKAPQSGAS